MGPAKKAPAKKTPAKKVAAPKKAPAKKTPAKKVAAPKKAAVKKPPAKKTPAKKVAAPKKAAVKKAPAAKATPPAKAAPVKSAPPKATGATKPEAKKASASVQVTSKETKSTEVASSQAALATDAAPKVAVKAPPAKPKQQPKPRVVNPYASDPKFLEEIRELLLEERSVYQQQAETLRAEADSLAQEREPGDVQFDEESGEGGTVAVDRERDLTLSAQALATIEEIDRSVGAVDDKSYGSCDVCGQPIPKARLRALPYANMCIQCKSGGLHRR